MNTETNITIQEEVKEIQPITTTEETTEVLAQ